MPTTLGQDARTRRGRLSSPRTILWVLFLGNTLNFYDRALTSALLEPIKEAYGLADAEVGIIASAFVLFAAVAAIPLGRLADRVPRRSVAGWGLMVWSLCTGVGGFAVSFWVFFASRIGVGVGEASYSPATGSLISDLYPAERRSRATALFTLGFPIGTLLAFLTAGPIAEGLGTWRAPFLFAMVPGILLALVMLRIREPRRGAQDGFDPDGAAQHGAAQVGAHTEAASVKSPSAVRAVLRIRSVWGLIVAFAGYNFAAYAVGTFVTPVLQRYFGLSLTEAGAAGGLVLGVSGLVGLLVAGPVLDRARARSGVRRDLVAVVCLAAAAVFALVGLSAGRDAVAVFVGFMGLSYLFGIVFLAVYVPAAADVVPAERRSTALGVIVAAGLLIGGAGGPIAVGVLSDVLRSDAVGVSDAVALADGLHTAMLLLIPLAFLVAAAGMLFALKAGRADAARLTRVA